MIDLYTWTTPNGRKVSILLEELGIEYRVHTIDISKGDQFSAEFLQIAPNNRIPAIVDHETGVQLMESAAIMLYLSDKYNCFHCTGTEHWRMMEWLMWQMGGFGPMLGQAHHFLHYNLGKSEYAEQRYGKEAARLYTVLDTRLSGRDYLVGTGRGAYTIADMAIWPWVSRFQWQQIDLKAYPQVCEWYTRIAERPAVQSGYQVPHYSTQIPKPE